MPIRFDLTRPLELAEHMVRNSDVDNRKKFRCLIKVMDSNGRNLTLFDGDITIGKVSEMRRRKSGAYTASDAFRTPTTWTVAVIHPDDVLIRTIPFVKKPA